MKAFFDIDTQLDFVTPGGALYGAGAERLIPAVATLNRYAGDHAIPLISTTDVPHLASALRHWHVWPTKAGCHASRKTRGPSVRPGLRHRDAGHDSQSNRR